MLFPLQTARTSARIRFLWSASLVGTSGNPAVKPRGCSRLLLLPDFSEKIDIQRCADSVPICPYYCIATACELWFERLDLDAF